MLIFSLPDLVIIFSLLLYVEPTRKTALGEDMTCKYPTHSCRRRVERKRCICLIALFFLFSRRDACDLGGRSMLYIFPPKFVAFFVALGKLFLMFGVDYLDSIHLQNFSINVATCESNVRVFLFQFPPAIIENLDFHGIAFDNSCTCTLLILVQFTSES